MKNKKPKRKVIILLDGNHMSHRAYHSMGRMSYNGKGTGVIFGFLQIMFAATTRFKPNKIMACFDGGRNKHRLKILPTYKEREQRIDFDAEDFHRQKRALNVMLKSLGIPQLVAPDQEADDFIYTMTKKYQAKGWKVIIVSGDKDFRQLVDRYVWIYDNNKGLIHTKNFKATFGIRPDQYADFLCLDGDKSDKIPGVPGVGEKTAIKMLTEFNSVKGWLGDGKNAKKPNYSKVRETFDINRQLIDLKVFDQMFGPQKLVYYKGLSKPKSNSKKYLEVCAKYGIRKFTKNEYLNSIP